MANLVYNMVCDAFADLISRRAAENLVKEALRDIGSNPDRVTALEMQELLRKGIFKRLQKIIPVMKAKGEIKRLLRNLEKTLAQPSSAVEDSEDWDEPNTEAVDLGPWEVQTQKGQAEQGQAEQGQAEQGQAEQVQAGARAEGQPADSNRHMSALEPLRSTPILEPQTVGVSSSPSPNATGFDFLAVPGLTTHPDSPDSAALAPSPSSTPLAASSGPYEVPPSEVSPSPATPKNGEAEMSTDENIFVPMLTTSESSTTAYFQPDPVKAASPESNLPETLNRSSEPAESELVQVGEEQSGTLEGVMSEFDADLFEFEAVDLPGLDGLNVPLESKPVLREYKRQDAILSRMALESGVSDVMLSLRSAEVLHARVNRVEPAQLAGAVAYAAQPADGGVAPGLFYADLGEQFILVSPLDDQVLLSILAASSTNIGRLLSEIIALKEEL